MSGAGLLFHGEQAGRAGKFGARLDFPEPLRFKPRDLPVRNDDEQPTGTWT